MGSSGVGWGISSWPVWFAGWCVFYDAPQVDEDEAASSDTLKWLAYPIRHTPPSLLAGLNSIDSSHM